MSSTVYSTDAEFNDAYSTLHKTFATGRTKSIKWRKWQLKQVWWMLEQNQQRWIDALHQDLNRHPFETLGLEFRAVKSDIVEFLEHVDEWAQGEDPKAGFIMGTLGKAWLRKEPLGVALIIGAWNFPLFTLLSPALAAIVAGNAVLLKPSELATATQSLLAELVPKYLDQSAIRVITGGPAETSKILKHKFNHIFYTGGGKVGRIIAEAAAKHLTPVVLELGGQGPVIVTKTANIDIAAKRIAHAKLTNSGQVCLNANHVFADPAIHDQLLSRLQYWFDKFRESGDDGFATIINDRHFDRISGLLKSTAGVVVYGGELNRSKKFISPTVVRDVLPDDSLLSEELFGPIAPVVVADVDRAIRLINSLPHALALYIFSSDQQEINKILDNTNSGGVTINDLMLHVGVPNAPFGGVGESGYGAYHGKHGFEAFSHTRTVVTTPNWLEKVLGFRYAPFKLENAKFLEVKSKLVGKPGETLEDQKVGKPGGLAKIVKTAALAVAVLAAADSASGGRLLVVQSFKDVLRRVWQRG